MSAPYEKVAVGKNMQYVARGDPRRGHVGSGARALTTSPCCAWTATSTVDLVKLTTPLAPAGKDGSVAVDGEPDGPDDGRTCASAVATWRCCRADVRLPLRRGRPVRASCCRRSSATTRSSAGPRSASHELPRPAGRAGDSFAGAHLLASEATTHDRQQHHSRRPGDASPTRRLQGVHARRLHVPPRRVLRAHHLADGQPRDERRRLPARPAARRGMGLLLRHGQLRRRHRHRQPLRHRRPVRRPLQRRLPQGRARPHRELRRRPHDPRDVQGDARRLDERELRSVRQPGRDRQAVRGRRTASTPLPSPAAASPRHGWSACRATSRSVPTPRHPINRMFADVSQDEPEVHAEPGFEGEVAGVQPVRLPVAART